MVYGYDVDEDRDAFDIYACDLLPHMEDIFPSPLSTWSQEPSPFSYVPQLKRRPFPLFFGGEPVARL